MFAAFVARQLSAWRASEDRRLPLASTSLDILEERYARGEINREEYLEKKRDIAG